jgi:hypothetical protein
MCLNCGCGDPSRRQRPTDITLADVARAAAGSYKPTAEVVRNMRISLAALEPSDDANSANRAAEPEVRHPLGR